jgi:lysophospholipase L1-like esterase
MTSLVVAAAMAELGLRLAHKYVPVWNFYYPRFYLSDDPVLGFVPTPNFSAPWRRFLLSNNSLGLRDSEHPLEPKHGVSRILFVGDSQTWGANLNIENTYAAQLQRNNVEVILGGVPGYASDQAVARAEKLIAQYHPSAVVLAIFHDLFYGDVPRLAAHKQYGLYRVHDGYLIPQEYFQKLSGHWLDRLCVKLTIVLRAHSHLATLLMGSTMSTIHARTFAIPMGDAQNDLLNNIARFQQICKSNNCAPILLIIPSMSHLVTKSAPAEQSLAEIKQRTKTMGLPTFDLHPYFTEALQQNVPIYFPDNHLSPAGHSLIAEKFSAYLNETIRSKTKK